MNFYLFFNKLEDNCEVKRNKLESNILFFFVDKWFFCELEILCFIIFLSLKIVNISRVYFFKIYKGDFFKYKGVWILGD